MRDVVIAQTAFNPLQSGRSRSARWEISFQTAERIYVEPLMGWTGSNDMASELNLGFDRLEDAVRYVKSRGWAYTVKSCPQKTTPLRPKRYMDNFLSSRIR